MFSKEEKGESKIASERRRENESRKRRARLNFKYKSFGQ